MNLRAETHGLDREEPSGRLSSHPARSAMRHFRALPLSRRAGF